MSAGNLGFSVELSAFGFSGLQRALVRRVSAGPPRPRPSRSKKLSGVSSIFAGYVLSLRRLSSLGLAKLLLRCGLGPEDV